MGNNICSLIKLHSDLLNHIKLHLRKDTFCGISAANVIDSVQPFDTVERDQRGAIQGSVYSFSFNDNIESSEIVHTNNKE